MAGWKVLDDIWQPVPGEITVATGIPGHGKSEWLLSLAVNMAQLHDDRRLDAAKIALPSHESTMFVSFLRHPRLLLRRKSASTASTASSKGSETARRCRHIIGAICWSVCGHHVGSNRSLSVHLRMSWGCFTVSAWFMRTPPAKLVLKHV